MKKRQIIEGTVIRRDFPNKGVVGDLVKVTKVYADNNTEKSAESDTSNDAKGNSEESYEKLEGTCIIKNTLPGQRVRGIVTKRGKNRLEARLLEVIEEAPDAIESTCPHFGICGSCHYLSMTYEQELALKEEQVKKLLFEAFKRQDEEPVWDGIKKSPIRFEYRNKMEFSFGDEIKNGPLSLGMHKRGSMHDIVTVKDCNIIDADYRKVLTCVLDYFADMYVPMSDNDQWKKNIINEDSNVFENDDINTNDIDTNIIDTNNIDTNNIDTNDIVTANSDLDTANKVVTGKETVTFYHTMQKTGYLRHLLVRKARKTGQILVDLVTTTQEEHDLIPLKDALLALDLDGEIVGFLHTKNDSLSDAVVDQGTDIIYGQDHFTEELLGLKFDISPFSFFQTNSLSAEVLYDTVRDYVKEGMKEQGRDKAHILYDLYCGTGTISQLMSPVADKVIGVEIIEEAVEAAKINAKRNNVDNCEFIAGDVLKVLDEIKERPDYIILDPPRDGIHPKALKKIIDYGVDHMVYVSCKPTSLQRDLVELQAAGYKIERACAVNQFPCTVHVETVVLLTRVN